MLFAGESSFDWRVYYYREWRVKGLRALLRFEGAVISKVSVALPAECSCQRAL